MGKASRPLTVQITVMAITTTRLDIRGFNGFMMAVYLGWRVRRANRKEGREGKRRDVKKIKKMDTINTRLMTLENAVLSKRTSKACRP